MTTVIDRATRPTDAFFSARFQKWVFVKSINLHLQPSADYIHQESYLRRLRTETPSQTHANPAVDSIWYLTWRSVASGLGGGHHQLMSLTSRRASRKPSGLQRPIMLHPLQIRQSNNQAVKVTQNHIAYKQYAHKIIALTSRCCNKGRRKRNGRRDVRTF